MNNPSLTTGSDLDEEVLAEISGWDVVSTGRSSLYDVVYNRALDEKPLSRHAPGDWCEIVYAVYREDVLMYVGRSVNSFRKRLVGHLTQGVPQSDVSDKYQIAEYPQESRLGRMIAEEARLKCHRREDDLGIKYSLYLFGIPGQLRKWSVLVRNVEGNINNAERYFILRSGMRPLLNTITPKLKNQDREKPGRRLL